MSNFDYTCRCCSKPGTFKNFDSFDGSYETIHQKNLRDLTNEERDFAFAIRSIHVECFDNVVEEYKKSIHAGSYVSANIFDDDTYQNAFVIHYVHKILDSSCEVWTINSSTRYVRKGGEFLEKTIVPIEDAISYMFVNMTNEATVDDLRNILSEYVLQERRRFMMEIVEAETEVMINNSAFDVYPTVDLVDEYHSLLDDTRVLEENLVNAEILSV